MSALLDAILGLGSGVLDVLDMPGSYLRGGLAGRLGDRLSGREMLNEWGVTSEENDPDNWFEGGDITGTAAGMVFDPLNWIGLGLAGKTAGAAKSARLANEGIAAQNAGIDAANAMSQMMRAKGALPEELLPQAERIYEYLPEGNFPIQQVPGAIERNTGLYGAPRNLDDLHRDRSAFLPRDVDPVTADAPMRFNPQLRKMDDDQLLDIKDALNAYQDYRQFPNEFSHAAHAADDFANKLLDGSGMSGLDLTDVERMAGDFRSRISRLYKSNLDRIDADETVIFSRNSHPGELGVSRSDPYAQRVEYGHHPQDLYDDILKSPNDPMHRYAKAEQDIGNIGRGLIGEIRRSMAPMPEAYQSYYAIPGTKYIDRELEQALTSEKFPATLLQSLERNLTGLGAKYPDTHGIGSPYFQKNMEGVRGFLGDEKAERLIAQLTEGRKIPGLYSDVFEGGQTFLPYIAPAFKETIPYQEVSKMPSRLLAALLGYNAAQTAGGY